MEPVSEDEVIDSYKQNALVQMRLPTVKDKRPNPFQLTAEQLVSDPELYLRRDMTIEPSKFLGDDEAEEYKSSKRKKFEETLRRQKHHLGTWAKYAGWEFSLGEIDRGRSIFERAIDVDPYDPSLWMRYADAEIEAKCPGHAENVLARAVGLMPREAKLWRKFLDFQKGIGNLSGSERVLRQWAETGSEEGFLAWAGFESGRGNEKAARGVMRRFWRVFGARAVVANGRFEVKMKKFGKARGVFEKGVKEFPPSALGVEFFEEFAGFEEARGEFKRAVQIVKQGLEEFKDNKKLLERLAKVQRRLGVSAASEAAKERRRGVEGLRLEGWLARAKLELSAGNIEAAEAAFASGLELGPLGEGKVYRDRYVAMAEVASDLAERTRGKGLSLIKLAMSKVKHPRLYIAMASMYLRGEKLDLTRKTLGRGVAETPKKEVFEFYLDLEFRLGQSDRCRKIVAKMLEMRGDKEWAWRLAAENERKFGCSERGREVVEAGGARLWPVLLSYDVENPEAIRRGLDKAEKQLKSIGDREQRAVLLGVWLKAEEEWEQRGIKASLEIVKAKQPRKIREGEEEVWRFPSEDEAVPVKETQSKLQLAAMKWKAQQPDNREV